MPPRKNAKPKAKAKAKARAKPDKSASPEVDSAAEQLEELRINEPKRRKLDPPPTRLGGDQEAAPEPAAPPESSRSVSKPDAVIELASSGSTASLDLEGLLELACEVECVAWVHSEAGKCYDYYDYSFSRTNVAQRNLQELKRRINSDHWIHADLKEGVAALLERYRTPEDGISAKVTEKLNSLKSSFAKAIDKTLGKPAVYQRRASKNSKFPLRTREVKLVENNTDGNKAEMLMRSIPTIGTGKLAPSTNEQLKYFTSFSKCLQETTERLNAAIIEAQQYCVSYRDIIELIKER